MSSLAIRCKKKLTDSSFTWQHLWAIGILLFINLMQYKEYVEKSASQQIAVFFFYTVIKHEPER